MGAILNLDVPDTFAKIVLRLRMGRHNASIIIKENKGIFKMPLSVCIYLSGTLG